MFETFVYYQRLTGHETNIMFEAFIVMDNFIKVVGHTIEKFIISIQLMIL